MSISSDRKSSEPVHDDTPPEEAVALLVSTGIDRMEAMKTVARQRGLSKRDVYKLRSEVERAGSRRHPTRRSSRLARQYRHRSHGSHEDSSAPAWPLKARCL